MIGLVVCPHGKQIFVHCPRYEQNCCLVVFFFAFICLFCLQVADQAVPQDDDLDRILKLQSKCSSADEIAQATKPQTGRVPGTLPATMALMKTFFDDDKHQRRTFEQFFWHASSNGLDFLLDGGLPRQRAKLMTGICGKEAFPLLQTVLKKVAVPPPTDNSAAREKAEKEALRLEAIAALHGKTMKDRLLRSHTAPARASTLVTKHLTSKTLDVRRAAAAKATSIAGAKKVASRESRVKADADARRVAKRERDASKKGATSSKKKGRKS